MFGSWNNYSEIPDPEWIGMCGEDYDEMMGYGEEPDLDDYYYEMARDDELLAQYNN